MVYAPCNTSCAKTTMGDYAFRILCMYGALPNGIHCVQKQHGWEYGCLIICMRGALPMQYTVCNNNKGGIRVLILCMYGVLPM